jgi:hypothetical protein
MKDKLSLVKQGGDEFNDIIALVQPNLILVDDESLPIEEGDALLRKLPNGLIEKYIVVDRGFISAIGGLKAHYQIKVRKEGTIRSRSELGNTFNLHGTHARVNIDSQDNSTNISHVTTETVFNDIRQAIQNISNQNDKEILLTKLAELEETKGTKKFTEKYREFMALAADHLGVISPFIPALSQLLS